MNGRLPQARPDPRRARPSFRWIWRADASRTAARSRAGIRLWTAACASFALLASLGGPSSAVQEGARQLHIPGRLTGPDGSPVPDSTWWVTFRLHDSPTGGTSLWSESLMVRTRDGAYLTTLGLQRSLEEALREKRWLSVQLGQAPELLPRTAVDPGVLSVNADMVDGYHVFSTMPRSGAGYQPGLGKREFFRIQGDEGPADLFVPISHWVPFRFVVTCPHAAPRAGDIAYAECVENDGVVSCLGVDGSGQQIRTSASLGSTDRILSVRDGHVTVSCPGDSTLRFWIHTQGEWVLGYILD